MLRQVLREIEAAQGPVSLQDLSRRLGIEPGALEGMIAFWVRKGRLKEGRLQDDVVSCAGGGCAGACTGAESCLVAGFLPRTFSVQSPQEKSPR